MARPSIVLVEALRATAARLDAGAAYQWGHFGRCNCGHLVQTICRLDGAAIHRWASERAADWGDLANEHCPTSGLPIDLVFAELTAAGLSPADLAHLEELSDPEVVGALGRWPRRNDRADAVAYLRAWADLLARAVPARLAA
jgi:hypothetical protein